MTQLYWSHNLHISAHCFCKQTGSKSRSKLLKKLATLTYFLNLFVCKNNEAEMCKFCDHMALSSYTKEKWPLALITKQTTRVCSFRQTFLRTRPIIYKQQVFFHVGYAIKINLVKKTKLKFSLHKNFYSETKRIWQVWITYVFFY